MSSGSTTADITIALSPEVGGTVEIDDDAPCSYPATITVDLRDTITIKAVPSAGYHFSGWSGEPTLDEHDNPVEVEVRGPMAITANFTADFCEFSSNDGAINIVIPDGTDALDEDGLPLTEVEFTVIKNPPQTQEVSIIGQAYDLEPDGATFDPPITLTWSYDPADIPEGVEAEEMISAYYDSESHGWIGLDSDVNPEKTIITAAIEHFSTFVITTSPASPAPVIPLSTTATFTVSSLSISPGEASTGEPVDISVLLTNTSELEGSYIMSLKIGGVTEETETVSLPGGASETVTFTIVKEETGDYDVDVSGLPGSFSVSPASLIVSPTPPPAAQQAPSPEINWFIIIPVLVAVFLAIFIPLWIRRRRDSFDW
jgi:hypothetical protein